MSAAMGKDGMITFDASTVPPAYIDTWTLTGGIGTAEITAFGNSAKQFAPTLREWSVVASGTLDHTDTKQDAVLDLLAATSTPSAVALRLYDGSSAASTCYWGGAAYLTGVNVGSNVADKVAVTYNFQGTSGLYYITT